MSGSNGKSAAAVVGAPRAKKPRADVNEAVRPKRRGLDPVDAMTVKTLKDAVKVFFSRPGPRLIAATAAVGWAGRALLGPPGPTDVAICAGVVGYWPFQEWLVHKYVLHLKPKMEDGKVTFDPDFAKRHRAHHKDPRDVDLTMLPFKLVERSLFTNAVLLLAFAPKRAALTGIAASATMLLAYEWTHFIVHTGHVPSTRVAKALRRHHLLHHFHNENYWMSFTVPLVDKVLGTSPDMRAVPRSATARNLHGMNDETMI